jgi:hypothetical protein
MPLLLMPYAPSSLLTTWISHRTHLLSPPSLLSPILSLHLFSHPFSPSIPSLVSFYTTSPPTHILTPALSPLSSISTSISTCSVSCLYTCSCRSLPSQLRRMGAKTWGAPSSILRRYMTFLKLSIEKGGQARASEGDTISVPLWHCR